LIELALLSRERHDERYECPEVISATQRSRPVSAELAYALVFIVAVGSVRLCDAAVIDIDSIRLTTSSLAKMESFYRDALGFRTIAHGNLGSPSDERLLGLPDPAKTLTMQLGRDRIQFIEFARRGRPYPRDSLSPDLWFQHFAIVVTDIDTAYARLRRSRFQPISVGGPQTLPETSGRVRAFKFRDPDGHPLELLYFPPGEGRSVWSGPGEITRGIDHTAIGVANTAASMEFYGKLLGMSVSYEAVNQGITQENLDGTFDAMVRITGFRPESANGPGIELLDYRAPSTGRHARVDARANDLWHVETVLRVDALDETIDSLIRAGVRFVSPGIVALTSGKRAASVLDPDGHVIVIED
jgi:catechol 2,3-dioxygenase-like lactoylglutathione lyase family enzyme